MRDAPFFLSDLSAREVGKIAALADRLERLAPSHRDPHRFYEERSELAYGLRELAREARR